MEAKMRQLLGLARAYNQYYTEAFERGSQVLLDQTGEDVDVEAYLEGLRNSVANDADDFLRRHLLPGGQATGDFLEELDPTELLPAFDRLASLLCEGLPDRLLLRLGQEVQTVLPGLRQRAFSTDWHLEPDGDFSQALQEESCTVEDATKQVRREALTLLGQWRDEESVARACALFRQEAGENVDEYQGESTQVFFAAQAPEALDQLLPLAWELLEQELETGKKSNRLDYVQILLVDQLQAADEGRAREAVYELCRECLRKRQDRVISAVLLGQIGDPRAIPLLRRMAEKAYHEQDRQLHYECLAALDSLGADTSDLPRLPLRKSALQA